MRHSRYPRYAVGILNRTLSWISMSGLVIMMAFTVISVVARYFFNSPLVGDYELTMLLLIMVVVPSFAMVQQKNVNIRVDVFYEMYSRRWKIFIDTASYLAMALLCALMTWGTFAMYQRTLKMGQVSEGMNVPVAPFLLLMCIGIAATSLQFLISSIDALLGEESESTSDIIGE